MPIVAKDIKTDEGSKLSTVSTSQIQGYENTLI